jgi:hypothetical protein
MLSLLASVSLGLELDIQPVLSATPPRPIMILPLEGSGMLDEITDMLSQLNRVHSSMMQPLRVVPSNPCQEVIHAAAEMGVEAEEQGRRGEGLAKEGSCGTVKKPHSRAQPRKRWPCRPATAQRLPPLPCSCQPHHFSFVSACV